jgi:hypothetical protein
LVYGETDGLDLAVGKFMSSRGLTNASDDLVIDHPEKQQLVATAKMLPELKFQIDSVGSIERKYRRLPN